MDNALTDKQGRVLTDEAVMTLAADAYAFRDECDAREALRKARLAWGNPAGRESLPMTRASKLALLAISLMLGLAMGGML